MHDSEDNIVIISNYVKELLYMHDSEDNTVIISNYVRELLYKLL